MSGCDVGQPLLDPLLADLQRVDVPGREPHHDDPAGAADRLRLGRRVAGAGGAARPRRHRRPARPRPTFFVAARLAGDFFAGAVAGTPASIRRRRLCRDVLRLRGAGSAGAVSARGSAARRRLARRRFGGAAARLVADGFCGGRLRCVAALLGRCRLRRARRRRRRAPPSASGSGAMPVRGRFGSRPPSSSGRGRPGAASATGRAGGGLLGGRAWPRLRGRARPPRRAPRAPASGRRSAPGAMCGTARSTLRRAGAKLVDDERHGVTDASSPRARCAAAGRPSGAAARSRAGRRPMT